MKILIKLWCAFMLMGGLTPAASAVDYRSFAEVQATLLNLAQANPGIAKYVPSIGTSIEGRDIPAIKITKDPPAR